MCCFGEVAALCSMQQPQALSEFLLSHPSDTQSSSQSANQTKRPTGQPVIHTVIQPVSQRAPKPPGKPSPSFNQAEEAAAKERLNIAPFIIKHSRGGAVPKGDGSSSFTSTTTRMDINPTKPLPALFTSYPFSFSLDKVTCPITRCYALKLSRTW